MSAILEYPEGKIAVISSHTKVEMDNSAYIHGTKGTIKVIYTRWLHTKCIMKFNLWLR